MNHLNNILVTHDFSECSALALDYGIELALETGAGLHLLHVEIFHETPLLAQPSTKSKAEQLREKLRDDIYESVRKQGFDPSDIPGIQYSVESDFSAASAINRYSAENDIDLVVMGTHGRRGMALRMKQAELHRHRPAFYLGSVAEAVVRTAPCSVFTINEQLKLRSLDSGLKKITVPIVLTDEASEAISFAKNMAAFYEVSLELVYVIEGWEAPPYYDESNVLVYDQRDIKQRVLDKMQEVVEKAKGSEIEIEYVMLQGDPADEILRHLKSSRHNLVIMPINDVAGHWRYGIGSTVERVVRLANCPVLTFRKKQNTTRESDTAKTQIIAA